MLQSSTFFIVTLFPDFSTAHFFHFFSLICSFSRDVKMLSCSVEATLEICSHYSCYEGLLLFRLQVCLWYEVWNDFFNNHFMIAQVKADKVNLIIGSGGKKVKSIIEETGVESIETQDNGIVSWEENLYSSCYLLIPNILQFYVVTVTGQDNS